jgi:hypothetical protein
MVMAALGAFLANLPKALLLFCSASVTPWKNAPDRSAGGARLADLAPRPPRPPGWQGARTAD